MTAVTSAPDTEVRRSFSEVWFITIGHSLTHWYPATFYVLAPVIGNELGLSYPQIASISIPRMVMPHSPERVQTSSTTSTVVVDSAGFGFLVEVDRLTGSGRGSGIDEVRERTGFLGVGA